MALPQFLFPKAINSLSEVRRESSKNPFSAPIFTGKFFGDGSKKITGPPRAGGGFGDVLGSLSGLPPLSGGDATGRSDSAGANTSFGDLVFGDFAVTNTPTISGTSKTSEYVMYAALALGAWFVLKKLI